MTDISIRSLSKSYRGRRILNSIDLDVSAGTMLALLGPSGCGKTTLLRLISGFERPDTGEIRIAGNLVDSEATFQPPERRNVGYVPQEGALFPHLTVAGNVAYGLRDRKMKRERVRELLDLVGLADHAERFPRELSGGQQQRAALARALAPNPALILLDEPFGALDLDLRRRMSEEVMALLRKLGTTTVLVTHDPQEAFTVADAIAVMMEGYVVQYGDPRSVYLAPKNASIARLTGPALFIEGIADGDAVRTSMGLLPSTTADEPVHGRCVLFLRPEQLSVSENDGIAARVASLSFRGGYQVATIKAGDELLTVPIPAVANIANGQVIGLRVDGKGIAYPVD